MPIYMNIVVYDPASHQNSAFGDGSVRIACQNNLQQMVGEIAAQSSPGSIKSLRITSPGIIAVLIGLLQPAAAHNVREAASHANHQINFGMLLPAVQNVREAANKPQMEHALSALRTYFAPGGHVELRGLGMGVDASDPGEKMLVELSRIFGVPVRAGAVNPVNGEWSGPIVEATPQGLIRTASQHHETPLL